MADNEVEHWQMRREEAYLVERDMVEVQARETEKLLEIR